MDPKRQAGHFCGAIALRRGIRYVSHLTLTGQCIHSCWPQTYRHRRSGGGERNGVAAEWQLCSTNKRKFWHHWLRTPFLCWRLGMLTLTPGLRLHGQWMQDGLAELTADSGTCTCDHTVRSLPATALNTCGVRVLCCDVCSGADGLGLTVDWDCRCSDLHCERLLLWYGTCPPAAALLAPAAESQALLSLSCFRRHHDQRCRVGPSDDLDAHWHCNQLLVGTLHR